MFVAYGVVLRLLVVLISGGARETKRGALQFKWMMVFKVSATDDIWHYVIDKP